MHSAKRLPLPTAGADASRSKATETARARIATPPRFAESTECPRNNSGSMGQSGGRASDEYREAPKLQRPRLAFIPAILVSARV
jgi:hypothetical protein